MGSTISTTIGKAIVLGNPGYASPLTVTSAGWIDAPAPDTSFQGAAAIDVDVGAASISNYGVISGAIPATDSYVAPAVFAATPLNLDNYGTIIGQSGIYLENGGTVTNSGSVAGLETQGQSGYGVRLVNAELKNTGAVYGSSDGVANWNSSRIVNAGTIAGGNAGVAMDSVSLTGGGTLTNTGSIGGEVSGVTGVSALITNSGRIDGGTYGIRISWGGTVTNAGLVSAGVDGVLLLNAQYQAEYAASFLNSGTVQGGYFGMAINFATASNAASGLVSGTTFGVGVEESAYFFNAGNVYGVDGGLLTESGGRAVNAGTVHSDQIGVELFSDSMFTNASAGYVYSLGTAGLNQAAYFVNAGTMRGNVYGMEISSGGIDVNFGSVASERQGVYLSTLGATSSPDFLVNAGDIYGGQLGINLKDGTAYNYGIVAAAQIAATLVAGTSLDNSGYVYGGRYGVQLLGGSLANFGAITGKTDGIRLTHGYLTNAGTVTGGKYAVYGQSFSLTIDPGAVFNGNVVDKSKTSTLNLAGSTPGTLSGLGTQFNGFDAIDFKAGANWLISGTTAALAAQQVISGFEQGDTIVVTGFSATSDSFVSGRGLELISGSTVETLDITGSFTTANFAVTGSGTTTTIRLQSNAPCFLAGTRILTARGEVAVEALGVGETVITMDGDQPVLWIGNRTIDPRLHRRPEQVQPVCIAAGALGEDVPRRDLWVSPDHALLIDDVLVPAQLLLNGLNIRQGALARLRYYHVELRRHAVLFAENAPAESYLETGNRNAFANGGGGTTLHPDFSAMLRREKSCAALLLAGEKLDEIRGRILRRHLPGRRRLTA